MGAIARSPQRYIRRHRGARVRLDRKAASISLLVVLGVRADGQKVPLAVKNMGGETTEAWRSVLDDLVKRGLRKPDLRIVDGGAGLEAALAAIWGDVPTSAARFIMPPSGLCRPRPANRSGRP